MVWRSLVKRLSTLSYCHITISAYLYVVLKLEPCTFCSEKKDKSLPIFIWVPHKLWKCTRYRLRAQIQMEGTYTDIGDKYRIVQFFQGACNAELHVPLFQSFFCFKVAKKEMQNCPVAWNELRTGRNTTLIISHSILKRYTRRKALLVDCYQEKKYRDQMPCIYANTQNL